MKLDFGTIITIVVVVLFYFRLNALQYGRAKKTRAYDEAVKKDVNKKKKQIPVLDAMQKYGFKVISWPLVVLSIVLIAIGVALAAVNGLPQNLKDYWWVGICAGVIVMGFNIKY
jgi:hypothetical protein